MILKIIGVILIIAGCGGCGFSMAAAYRNEENCLRQMLKALEYMSCELEYRQTELPQLCVNTARCISGPSAKLFSALAAELEQQVAPDARHCMDAAVAATALPKSVRDIALELGATLGEFDLSGQHSGIQSAMALCQSQLQRMNENRETRLRNYQTLGLCAGAALAILFI